MFFGFGKKPKNATERLSEGRWQCASCDEWHEWPFDLAAFAPDPWQGPEEYEHNGALRLDGDFLSEDFCVLGGDHFLIRAVLTIPVIGLDEHFGFGCWSTLSRANFEKYLEGFDSIRPVQEELWSGWLCNQLADFVGVDPIALWVQLRPGRQRPLLWVQDDDHPLAIAQTDGISVEHLLSIFARYGHEPA